MKRKLLTSLAIGIMSLSILATPTGGRRAPGKHLSRVKSVPQVQLKLPNRTPAPDPIFDCIVDPIGCAALPISVE